MKKLMVSLVMVTSLAFLGGCQKVSKDEVSSFFEQDLAALVANYTEAHSGTDLNNIDVDFDGKKIDMTIQGRDNEKEYEVSVDPLKNKVIKDKSETLDRDDQAEQEPTISDVKNLKSLKELQSALEAEKINLEKIESLDLTNELSKDIWEVQVKDGSKELNYHFDAKTLELLQTEND